ncbi:MAG TPA: TetR/AcrR family transcriptional regulator [Oligoflexus sp.]|uniref:TetR/AcrR family transcriptional regulator n=1 Tax=Oligoflexus sp. TaxID=1971216 RepID=UPI002D371D8B|nr:TetR/AcrR family transcriptional regulator [Oligoflexus sp.]HYX36503.1 TetR/AcrR family transcriptional regulator [Oligoflexus sp.]
MGRPKLFDRKDVTDKALQVFWRKGYLDTSLKDIEEATGVFKPALYSEFGDKEGLFLECIQYYREHYSGRLHLLKEPFGWKNIEAFLKSVLPDKLGRGCFEVSASTRDFPVLNENLKSDEYSEKMMTAIERNLKAAGEETKTLNILTEIIFTFYCGLAALALSQPRRKLEKRVTDFLNFIRMES